MRYIKTLTAEETAQKLRSLGMTTSPVSVRCGIKAGAYPFGDYFMVDKHPKVTIYAALLDEWIAARLVEEEQE